MESRNSKALSLIETWLDSSVDPAIKASQFIRGYIRICQLLDLDDEIDRCMKELTGYAVGDEIPGYRKVSCVVSYQWIGTLPYSITSNQKVKEKFYETRFDIQTVFNPITTLENHLEAGISFIGDKKELHGVAVTERASFTTADIKDVVEAIKNDLFIKVSKLAITLEFDASGKSLFEEAKAAADSALINVSPKAQKNVSKAYNELSQVKDSADASKIALLCLEALRDFSEGIYKEEYLPQGQAAPTRDQFINRIKFTVRSVTGSKSKLAYINTLLAYLSDVKDYMQTTKHRSDLAAVSDARRIVLYTYLIIRDVVDVILDSDETNPN